MKLKLILTTAIVGTALALPAASSAAQNAYVTAEASFSVFSFTIGQGGLLSPLDGTPTDPNPHAVTVSPDGRSVYVANGGESFAPSTVSQYDVNPLSGALSPKTPPSVAAGPGPEGITVTPDGTSAYATNIDGTVSQYSVDLASGALSPKTPATVAANGAAQGVAVTPDGTGAYVTNLTSGTVSQYDIDPVNGTLSPKTPATVAAGEAPRDVAVTPDGKSAYVADQNVNTVSQYDIDPVNGTLSPKTPATVAAGPAPFGIAVTPDGKSAYVTDATFNGANNNTVSQYNIDPSSGALSPKTPASVAAGTAPIDIAVTEDGENAYVTNVSGPNPGVSQYSIDPASGNLSPKTPAMVAAGLEPYGVAVRGPGVPTSKEQCKRGGWRNFPLFKNEGQCIAFVNHSP